MQRLIFIFTFLLTINAAQADPLGITAERLTFLQAKSALAHGNIFNFKWLSNQLQQYVLYPYLQYAALLQQLDLRAEPQVKDFLTNYANTPLADRLRSHWLITLANKQQWQLYLKYYQKSNDTTLQCYYTQALWQTQQKTAALKILPSLWLNAYTLPNTCMPILKMWQTTGALTDDLAWQRVRMAVHNNQLNDKNLLMLLPATLQIQAKLWQTVRNKPSLITQSNLFYAADDYTQEILLDGIQRFAIQKPQEVAAQWSTLQEMYDFSNEEKQIITRAIAIELARSADPNAMIWLSTINPTYVNDLVRAWRIRSALAQQNWLAVIKFIEQLSITEKQQPVWQYWYARALAMTGKSLQSQQIYYQLAKQVNYYGLLASQQLHNRYRPDIYNNTQAGYTHLMRVPAIQRAYELYSLRMIGDARREWQWALKSMNPAEMHTAAQLAMQWNWYDRALITAAKAGDYDFTVRFPLAYREQVILSAQQLNLDPAWVLAIMRQESAFMPDAKSTVGALGLMQLMPKTARLLSAKISDYGILDTTTNIMLGSRYLKQLYTWFNDNETIATAAYNIGPTRLAKWLPFYKKLPSDVWVDILPWQETRDYVQTVTLATAIYKQRLNEDK